MKEIAICIQIRKASERLPEKSLLEIGEIPVYEHMYNNVTKCCQFINKHKEKKRLTAKVFFLVPYDEFDYWQEIKETKRLDDIEIISGNEDNNDDVFCRFNRLFRSFKPEYIARITGDCPFIPSAIINKAVNCISNHRLDYISNVDMRYRTIADGYDIEIMSDEAFLWLANNIDKGTKEDKEHVTTYLRRNTPTWMRIATITSALDMSDLKLSLDTKEDYENLSKRYLSKIAKDSLAEKHGLGIYEF